MDRLPVELEVGGRTYKVRASAGEDELHRLADVVDTKLREIAGPDRALAPSQLVLVALALAHELEAEREKRCALEQSWRARLKSILQRIDAALDEGNGDRAPPPTQPHPDQATR